MNFDFSNEAFFDNHTHLLFKDKLNVTADEFAINYYHGVRDGINEEGVAYPSADAVKHLPYQGVIMTLVNYMSQRFDCEPTLDAVVAVRNSMTKSPQDLMAYTKLLYDDENVIGTVLDSELPMGHSNTMCFPCEVYRLFRYEDVFFELLKTERNYDDLMHKLSESIRRAVATGFMGLKGHIAEKFSFAVREVSDQEAKASFVKAQQGDKKATESVYFAMFSNLLELCQELDIPLHLHTGTTGFKNRTDVHTLDPILMAPYLKNPRYFKSKIVLLHGSFPYTRNGAIMAFNFPNVYLDLSQTLPWQSLLFDTCLEDALSIAPHDKIMLGTGQHWYAEMVWVAAKIAKSSLEYVMDKLVSQNLLSLAQAEQSAKMVLSQNANNLYKK